MPGRGRHPVSFPDLPPPLPLPRYTWSEPRIAQGHPPVGEIETRCPGCHQRFIAGETYVARGVAGILTTGIYAHPGACAERLEAMGV
jgi:hypothetical protein